MAVIMTVRQTPSERKLYTLDYSNWLGAGETISTFTNSTLQTDTPVAKIDAFTINVGQTSVNAFISGGNGTTEYQIFATITTNLGQTKEDEIRVVSYTPTQIDV